MRISIPPPTWPIARASASYDELSQRYRTFSRLDKALVDLFLATAKDPASPRQNVTAQSALQEIGYAG